MVTEEEQSPLEALEQKIADLLREFTGLKKERDQLANAVVLEREKVSGLEKKLELLSEDRDKVKTRIDQLLVRFRDVDL